MKKILAILLAALMVFSLAACSTSGTPEKADEPQAPAQGEPEAEEEQLETASASSDENGVLMVYSPQAAEERGVWIKEHAEAALGFEINFLSAKGGELSERLRAEKNNPQADVIMGLVQTAMYQLKEEDLITPYVPSWTEGLPEVYQDPDGYFNSYWQTPIVIGYNTDYVTNPPASWQDLIKEEYKGLYSIGVNTKQTVRTYIVGMLWPYYDAEIDDITDEGWEFLKALYLGLALIPQAGVAIGLAALGARTLGGTMGSNLQTIILASSVLYELIGPGCAKLALYLSKSYSNNQEDAVLVEEAVECGIPKFALQLLIERIRKIQTELPAHDDEMREEELAFTEAAEEQLIQTQAQRRYFYLRR